MPTQIVDDFGAWDVLGTVQPIFEQWVEFPDYTESFSNLCRLIFVGDLENIRSYAEGITILGHLNNWELI